MDGPVYTDAANWSVTDFISAGDCAQVSTQVQQQTNKTVARRIIDPSLYLKVAVIEVAPAKCRRYA
jgi:hypothetical protein